MFSSSSKKVLFQECCCCTIGEKLVQTDWRVNQAKGEWSLRWTALPNTESETSRLVCTALVSFYLKEKRDNRYTLCNTGKNLRPNHLPWSTWSSICSLTIQSNSVLIHRWFSKIHRLSSRSLDSEQICSGCFSKVFSWFRIMFILWPMMIFRILALSWKLKSDLA